MLISYLLLYHTSTDIYVARNNFRKSNKNYKMFSSENHQTQTPKATLNGGMLEEEKSNIMRMLSLGYK